MPEDKWTSLPWLLPEAGPSTHRKHADTPLGIDQADLCCDDVSEDAMAREDEIDALTSFYCRENEFQVIYDSQKHDDKNDVPRSTLIELNVQLKPPDNTSDFISFHSSSPLGIDTLPPMSIRALLRPGYPSTIPPSFGLRCSWISDEQLERLATEMDKLWSPGCTIVLAWVEWLRECGYGILTECGSTVKLLEDLPPIKSGQRCARWPRNGGKALKMIEQHCFGAQEEIWASELHHCGVCFEQHAPCDCLRFKTCQHTFCKSCISAYFASQMQVQSASALVCPEIGCGKSALPGEVRQVVSSEMFEKYERQLLQTSLDSMSDLVWCPRCQYPASLQEGGNGFLAICGQCTFSFCSECRLGWHGLSPCVNLADRWAAADDATKEMLRAKYGEQVLAEVQSSSWVKDNTKNCPKCSAATQKSGGCNHITCQKCRHEWCWLCKKTYVPGHYRNGSCEQFSDDFFEEAGITREEFERNYQVVNHY